MSKGFQLAKSSLPHDAIIFFELFTGYCGEDGEDYRLVNAGENIDQLGHELAYDNALSFDSLDEEEEEEINQRVEATAFHYQLSESGNHIGGGDPIARVIEIIQDAGGIDVISNHSVVIYLQRLKQLIYIPEGGERRELDCLEKVLTEQGITEITYL